MPAPVDTSSFLDLILRSQLLAGESAEPEVRRIAAEAGDDPQQVAGALVEAGVLTRWQSDRLLAGRSRGFRLGPYVLLDLLGKGGMGTVYLAEHSMMRRRVAIKILHSKRVPPGSTILERFHREARAVAQLDHPNIVRAFDLNHERHKDDDIHYLAMEYVDGENVGQRLERTGPFDVAVAVDLVRQAAEGLGHAHDRGFVHRDVKPANVMIDGEETVKILDLGLALLGEEHGEDSSLTTANDETLLGTADYVSPEQAIDSHSVDHRSDVYSLGCTFFSMLVGRAPYHQGSLAWRLRSHEVEPLPAIRTLRPDVPESVVRVVERMTAKQPEDRYESMAEVARDLFDWLLLNGDSAWRSRNADVSDSGALVRPVGEVPAEAETTDDAVPGDPRTSSSAHGHRVTGVAVAVVAIAALVWAIGRVNPNVDAPEGPDPSGPEAPSYRVADREPDTAPPAPAPAPDWAEIRESLRTDEDAILYLSFDVPPRDGRYANEAARSAPKGIPVVVVGNPGHGPGRRDDSHAIRLGGPSTQDRVVLGEQRPEAFEGDSDISFVVWFRVDPGGFEVPHQTLFAKGDNGFRLQRAYETSGLMFAINDFMSRKRTGRPLPRDAEVVGDTPVDDGRWHMVVAVMESMEDDVELRLYVDGRIEATNTSEHRQKPNGSVLLLGANEAHLLVRDRVTPDGRRLHFPRRSFHGEIDEVLILGRALNDDEVSDLYEATRPTVDPPPE